MLYCRDCIQYGRFYFGIIIFPVLSNFNSRLEMACPTGELFFTQESLFTGQMCYKR